MHASLQVRVGGMDLRGAGVYDESPFVVGGSPGDEVPVSKGARTGSESHARVLAEPSTSAEARRASFAQVAGRGL